MSTAEVYNIWLEHPELASSVDYLAVHILPFWEGVPGSAAVDHAIGAYQKLREAYPGKRIIIAEFGWPSAGLNRKDAVPSPLTQAEVVRDFITRAEAMGIDYSIIEAFDQPWKTNEGSVGPYWGVFDADRHPKFAFTGVVDAPNFVLKVIAALAIGLLLSIPIFAIPRVTVAQACVVAFTANAIGAWSANVVDYWVTHYFVLGSQIAMFVGACLLIPLIMIMKQRIEELAAIMFGVKPARLLRRSGEMPATTPFVSIHIPACREPPEMLRQTLDSVAKLDWPQFRMRGHNQQHARYGDVAADRGSLPRSRRAVQIRPRRPSAGLQGGRFAARAGTHRARGRDHRRARRRLCGAARTG